MPEVSRFYGIVIRMYWLDHPLPHFHADYAGESASIHIGTGKVIAGRLPRRALRMVRQWESMRRDDLLANWELVRAKEPLNPVDPLP